MRHARVAKNTQHLHAHRPFVEAVTGSGWNHVHICLRSLCSAPPAAPSADSGLTCLGSRLWRHLNLQCWSVPTLEAGSRVSVRTTFMKLGSLPLSRQSVCCKTWSSQSLIEARQGLLEEGRDLIDPWGGRRDLNEEGRDLWG